MFCVGLRWELVAANPTAIDRAREVESTERVQYVVEGGLTASILCQVEDLRSSQEGPCSPRPGQQDATALGNGVRALGLGGNRVQYL